VPRSAIGLANTTDKVNVALHVGAALSLSELELSLFSLSLSLLSFFVVIKIENHYPPNIVPAHPAMATPLRWRAAWTRSRRWTCRASASRTALRAAP